MERLKVGGRWNRPLKALQQEVLEQRRAAAQDGWAEVGNISVPAFFAGQSLLLTGATGFLGRLVMELVLRSSPDVDKIYVLVRSKRGLSAEARLRTAVADPLFDRLRAEQPGALESKVHVVEGDIKSPRLGLSDEDAALLCREVSVFLNVAASVRFNEPIKNATLTNLRSAREAVALAKAMPKLKVMVHVSTAYTNSAQPVVEERVYPAEQDWRTLIRAAEELPDPDNLTFLGPKLLGAEPNSYTFTKALAEQVIDEASAELPVIIVRPSIVMGTDRDPIPGWIDNLYGFSAFWALSGKGVIHVHGTTTKDEHHNLIPGDLVAKAIVLAAWAKGVGVRQSPIKGYSGVEVVHSVATGNLGPSFQEMAYLCSVLMEMAPMPGAVRYPACYLVSSKVVFFAMHMVLHVAFGALVDLALVLARQQPRLLDVYRKYVVGLSSVSYFQARPFNFRGDNQWRLQSLLLPSDTDNFCCLDTLDHRDSMAHYEAWATNTISGIVKYCFREKLDPDKARAHYRRLWWFGTVIEVIFALILFWVLKKCIL